MDAVSKRTALLVGSGVVVSLIAGAALYGVFVVRPQHEATIHVEQVDETSENVSTVVSFEELSREQQRDFERALNDTDGATRTYAQWSDVDYVRYQDTVYSVWMITI